MNRTCRAITGLTRDQWLIERRKYVCASDIGSLLGVGFHDAAQLARVKLGLTDETEANERMLLGVELEPYVARRFEERTGAVCLASPSLCVSEQYPFMAATPDRFIHGTGELAELKVVVDYPGDEWGEDGSSIIPEGYLCQCFVQMIVTGANRVYLCAYFVGREFRVYPIGFDEELAGMIVDAGREFHESLARGAVDGAWRSSYSPDVRRRILEITPGTKKQLDERAERLAREYVALGQIRKQCDDDMNLIKEELHTLAGDAELAVFPGGGTLKRKKVSKAGFTVKPSEYVDFRINLEPKKALRGERREVTRD